MDSSHHLWFCAIKTATLGPELHVSLCPRLHLWFSACKTACLALELLVSMGSSPLLWFLDAKQRLLDQNNKSLWFPDLICGFCMQNSVITIRITSHNGSQPSSVVLSIQNSDRRTKIACLYGSQTSPVVFYMQNSMPSIRIISLYGCQPSSVVFCMQNSDFWTRITSLYGSQTSPVLCAWKTAWLASE